MASVTFENVVKRYGNVTAVNNLNLEIPDKEFLVFVGPSGCGKSTSLRMLAGLEDISEGTIYIGDRPVNDVPPKDRDIAMVFQSYALYPHMSVYDNMAFALKLRAKTGRLRKMFTSVFNRGAYKRIKAEEKDIDDRVQKAASILGIQQLLPRKPRQLSGGQRQRVARGPRHRARAEGLPVRRAALQPRRETARADARRDHQVASAVGDDLHLRDARPDRSHDDGHAHRGDEGRPVAAGRFAAAVVRSSRQHVRGRLHRQPQHELLRSDRQGLGRQRGSGRRRLQTAHSGGARARPEEFRRQASLHGHPARGPVRCGLRRARTFTPATSTPRWK